MPKSNPFQPTPREVYYAARRYLPYLPPELQQATKELLRRARSGEKVDNALLEMLSGDPAAKQWLQAALIGGEAARLYEPLPGASDSIPAFSLWVCPKCGFEWRVYRKGRPVPPCPGDGSPLVRRQPPDAHRKGR